MGGCPAGAMAPQAGRTRKSKSLPRAVAAAGRSQRSVALNQSVNHMSQSVVFAAAKSVRGMSVRSVWMKYGSGTPKPRKKETEPRRCQPLPQPLRTAMPVSPCYAVRKRFAPSR